MNRYITLQLRIGWRERELYQRAAEKQYGTQHGALSKWMRDVLAQAAAPNIRELKEVFPDARVKRVTKAK